MSAIFLAVQNKSGIFAYIIKTYYMDWWEQIQQSKFYRSNSTNNSVANGIKLIQKESSFLGIPGDSYYKICWNSNNKHYECFVHQEVGSILLNTCNSYFFRVSDKIARFLEDLKKLLANYTTESCEKELKKFPNVWKFTKTRILDDNDWHIDGNTLRKQVYCGRDSFKSSKGIEIAKELSTEIDGLFNELAYFKLSIDNLKKIKPIIDLNEVGIPSWVKTAACVGGIVLIKVAIKSIGQDIDIDIPGCDDGDNDIDFDASDNYGNNSYLTNDGYNVSFGSSDNSDGYIHQGNISLERTISGITDSFPHYTKDGADFVKIGNSYIRIDSGTTVTIKNVKYDCI